MKDVGDEKNRFVAGDHYRQEILMEGGQEEAGSYLALLLRVKRERKSREAAVGREKLLEFQTACCCCPQLHIIIRVNSEGGAQIILNRKKPLGGERGPS